MLVIIPRVASAGQETSDLLASSTPIYASSAVLTRKPFAFLDSICIGIRPLLAKPCNQGLSFNI